MNKLLADIAETLLTVYTLDEILEQSGLLEEDVVELLLEEGLVEDDRLLLEAISEDSEEE